MEILNEIRQNLNQNENISKEMQDKLFNLIVTFVNKFPDISLETLNERIASLKVDRIGMYEKKGTVNYDVRENVIFLSSSAIKNKDYDIDHILMKAVIALIASKDNYYGVNQDNQLFAINEGIMEMIANYTIGNEGISDREEEYYAVNLISKIVGFDTVLSAYLSGDKDLLLSRMSVIDVGVTNDVIASLNYVSAQKDSGTDVPDLRAYATAIRGIEQLYLKQISNGNNINDVQAFGESLPLGEYFNDSEAHDNARLNDIRNHFSQSVHSMMFNYNNTEMVVSGGKVM